MSRGLPYDSDAGRDYAACLTAIMTGEAYAQSARIARDHGGPFDGYEMNREPFLRVMNKHRDAVKGITQKNVPDELYNASQAGVGRRGDASARIMATGTGRRPCWRRPGPSAS